MEYQTFFNTWNYWASTKVGKVFTGLPSSPKAVNNGYIPRILVWVWTVGSSSQVQLLHTFAEAATAEPAVECGGAL